MMKTGHAWSGAAAGLGAALVVGASPVPALISGAIGGGAALIPDIDQPSSTIARFMGPLSEAFAHGINALSAKVFEHTATEDDDDREGGHRTLTHTLVFAVGVGALTTVATLWFWGLLVVLFLCFSLALRGLLGHFAQRRGWIGTTVIAAGLAWAASAALPESYPGLGLGALIGFGCFVHCLGDSLTITGCPWAWPLVIAGERWYPIGTPEPMRFHTGGGIERCLVYPVLIVGTAALALSVLPGGIGGLLHIGDTVRALIP